MLGCTYVNWMDRAVLAGELALELDHRAPCAPELEP